MSRNSGLGEFSDAQKKFLDEAKERDREKRTLQLLENKGIKYKKIGLNICTLVHDGARIDFFPKTGEWYNNSTNETGVGMKKLLISLGFPAKRIKR